jgi:hypothetical protein
VSDTPEVDGRGASMPRVDGVACCQQASANAGCGRSKDRIADRHSIIAVGEQSDMLGCLGLGINDAIEGLARGPLSSKDSIRLPVLSKIA